MAYLRAKNIQCYGIGPSLDVEDGPKGFGAHSDQERLLETELHRFVSHAERTAKGRNMWRGRSEPVPRASHREPVTTQCVCAPFAGIASIRIASALRKASPPGPWPLKWPSRTTTRSCDGMMSVVWPPAPAK